MPEHIVEEGECIESIALDYGLFWETIWNHPNNADLKKQRKDPNVLMAGDIVFVPDKQLKKETRATEARHRFKRLGVPSKLRIRLMDDDQPRANESYTLVIGGKIFSGKTDSDGWLEQPVSPDAGEGKILVGEEQEEYVLKVGYLDPIEEISGVQARLNNLRFDCGPVDGLLGPTTESAIRRFQRQYDLPVTGQPDAATQKKLLEEHKG